MKKLLFLLATIISLNCVAQTKDKTVHIKQSELNEFFLAIDTLTQQDSLKTILITDLELQLSDYKTLSLQNDTIILLKNQEITELNNQINLYHDRLKITDRWYNKRWFGVVVGVVGTSTAIYLAGQISN